jgi:hypothetical protein
MQQKGLAVTRVKNPCDENRNEDRSAGAHQIRLADDDCVFEALNEPPEQKNT